MAAGIFDLDGTTFTWGTNQFLPGAYDQLKAFADNGNQLIFVTQRFGAMMGFEPSASTERYLKSLFPDCTVLFGISSPRILINDAGAFAINHAQDAAWKFDLNNIARRLS